ncbi:hypothetical protein E8E14_003229 [Neopestalotiopsis sp. 37M]|nr:hypothetical protein E8E14_003229 [Neopestalotiopsis sp. 37M]
MFKYQPLDRHENQLRFFRFVPRLDDSLNLDVPLNLELRHAPMDHVQYTALSYVWGDMTGLIEATINGESFAIGRNLHAALQRMRRTGFDSWIWADSICIQQSDNDEKSWLVTRMRNIYEQADLVYMWLGEGSTDTDRLFDFVDRMGPTALTVGALDLQHNGDDLWNELREHLVERIFTPQKCSSTSSKPELVRFCLDLFREKGFLATASPSASLITGMQELLEKSYWNRIWIIQEVALARRPIVVCGKKSVPLDVFDAILRSLSFCQSTAYKSPIRHKDFEGFGRSLYPSLHNIKALMVRQQHRDGEEVHLLDVLYNVGGPASGRPYYSATDPRDTAFALLGIMSEKGRLNLRIDYNQTLTEVFAALTRALLIAANEKLEGRHLFACCETRNYDSDLPTWVPDWQWIGRHGLPALRFNDFDRFNAAVGMSAPTRAESGERGRPMVLRRPGCVVDLITDVMEPPELVEKEDWPVPQIKDARAWLASILDFMRLQSESGPAEDYIWRTILVDDIYGDGRESEPVPEEILELIRRIMRNEHVEADSLTEAQVEFVQEGPCWGDTRLCEGLQEKLEVLMEQWPWSLGTINRGRTLFKTAKGMLGLGHALIQVGDQVSLLWGVSSPVVLRPRAHGDGFYLIGDAYVDGIMRRAFLRTSPVHVCFNIH